MRSVIAVLLFVLLAPATAWAGELQFGVVEDAEGVTVQVRGFEGEAPKKVITSRSGMLFFFDASKAKTSRLRPTQRHRMAYAQVGQTGNRVALRFAQRDRARGNLGAFVTATPVAGGLDIRIVDRSETDAIAPAPADVDAEENEDDGDPSAEERGSALAALEASLGGGGENKSEPTKAKVKPAAAPAPIESPEPEQESEPVAEAVGALAPELDAPALDPEPTPSTSSAGLRSILAVALMFAFGGAAIWWIKRRKQNSSTPVLDVVSRVGIGPKQSVVLINAGGRQLLIAATEKRIEVLAELGPGAGMPTAELRVPTLLERTRESFGVPHNFRNDAAPIAPPTDPTAPAKVAAFKARLEQALGRELTGEHPLLDADATPPHLRLLQSDPRWGREEGAA